MHSHQLVMKLAFLLALLAHLSCAAQAVLLNAASVAALKGFTDACCQPATSATCKGLVQAVNPARKASEDLCAVSRWCDAKGNQIALFSLANDFNCKSFPAKELSAMTSLEALDVSNNKLAGDLRDVTAMFDRLPNLKEFAATGNGLTGSLTCQLVKPGMRTLKLGDNSISGQLPACFLSSPTLLFLALERNKLSGPLPIPATGIALQELWIYANSFSGPIPREFIRMSKLKVLYLAVNQLTGTIPEFPSSLNDLSLYKNKLSGPIPDSIGKLRVEYLLLSENNLVGTIPAALLSNTNLLELGLLANQLTGRIDNLPWGNLKRTYMLLLSENKLTGPVPASIAAMANLTHATLNNNSFSGTLDAFAAALPTRNRLQSLRLQGNRLTGGVPQGLNKLATFTAKDCNPAEDSCFVPSLYLNGNPLTEAFPAWLSAALKPTANEARKRVVLPTTLQCSTATLDAAVQRKYDYSCMKDGRQVKVPVAAAPAGRRMLS